MDANLTTIMVRSMIFRLLEPFKRAFGGGHVKGMEKTELRHSKDAVTYHSLEAVRNRSRGDGVEISFFKTSNYLLFQDVVPEPVQGTCNWFFNDERYLEWLNKSCEDLLWLTADPMCGKSVLSKALVHNSNTIESSTTLHFFFSKANEQQHSATSALCALLHQLFSQYEHLFVAHGMRAHSLHGHGLISDFDALWQLLLETARDTGLHQVICILDGLDECRKDERHWLIRKLKDFHKGRDKSLLSTRGTIVKFFVTSRPYLDIESGFNNNSNSDLTHVARIAAEHQVDSISSDIAIVARAHIEEIRRSRKIPPEVLETALSKFLENKDSTYLFQQQALQAIADRNPRTPSEWRSVISQLTPSVEEVYESILSQSPDQDRATKILKIVVAASRPLTLSEMDIALATDACPSIYDDIQLYGDEYTAIHVRHNCGLFLKIVDSKIYLIHSTARPYLLRQVAHGLNRWEGCIGLSECHLALATTCVQHLLHDELRRDPFDEQSCKADDIFRAYSISNWEYHFRNSGVDGNHPLMRLVTKLYSRTRRWRRDSMDNILAPNTGSNLDTQLRMMVWHGQEDAVRRLLAAGADANSSVGDWGCTALHIAAQRGKESIVKVLLDAGASVDALHYGEGTALHEAAQRGFEKVTEVLIQEGANTGAYQPGRGTALHVAARQGNVKIVNMLLDAGVDANIDMSGDGIALYVAAAAGHDKLVDVLSTVSDVDVGRYGYWKALTFASMHGNAKMVDLLHRLATDSNNPFYNIKYRQVESEDTIYMEYRGPKDAIDTFKATYRTALKRASERGNKKMVVFLLDTAEATPTDSLGINPALRAAAAGGHLDVIEEFTRISRVSVNVWGKKYGCALHAAAWCGHKNVAARLLEVGADPFAQNEDHGTPLHIAAMRGHKTVVELLVQIDGIVGVVWQEHGTPLHVAAKHGHLSIVEVLLAQGADVRVTGDRFGTPLQAARNANYPEIVKLLFDAEQKQANEEGLDPGDE